VYVQLDDRFQAKLARIFIRSEQIFLERDLNAQVFIHSAIHRPHAALAKNINNSITIMKECVFFERHLKKPDYLPDQ